MSKFKIGDKIKLTGVYYPEYLNTEDVYVVDALSEPEGFWLGIEGVNIEGDDAPFMSKHFELAEDGNILEPLEVVRLMLEGTEELEYRLHTQGLWFSVAHPKRITLGTLIKADFRIKPKTMYINGVEVPRPIKDVLGQKERNTDEVTVYRIADNQHTIAVNIQHITKLFASLNYYYNTKEDAEAVIAAINKPFKELN